MILTSVTYTSLARSDLQEDDLEHIHRSARERNAQLGITGILIFNGTHFLQIIEGSESSIEGVLDRLRKDDRHTGFEIRDRRKVDVRSFPGWPMELVRVTPSYFEARDTIADRIPDSVPEAIRARLFRMTELISTIDFAN
jgi:hypothetical protein